MFARFSRHAIRRAVHTSSNQTRFSSSSSSAFPRAAFTVSLATAAYFAWQLSTPVALDSSSPIHADRQAMPSKPYISSTLEKDSSSLAPSSPTSPDTAPATEQPNDAIPEAESQAGEDSAGEGATSGAYNPVTGEINWDCPCLGGMAHGPCGQQFRDAFSCFVFSEEEPKGIDCVEKFKAMQNCFREHPDVYGDDDDDDELPTIDDPAPSELKPDSATLASPTTSPKESSPLELSSTSSS